MLTHTPNASARKTNGYLHTLVVMHMDGWSAPDIANAIGMNREAVNRALRSPKGIELLHSMQGQRVEALIDPIRQRLQEHADEAIDTLHSMLAADSESVRVQAARDILHMSGYKPHSGNVDAIEQVPQVIVNNNNNLVIADPSAGGGGTLNVSPLSPAKRTNLPSHLTPNANALIEESENEQISDEQVYAHINQR
jgi:hypothetical protein